MNKKKKIKVLIGIVAVVFIAVVVVLVVRRRKGLNKNESLTDSIQAVVTGYVAESFPLQKGMKGENVRIMQDTIGSLGYWSELGMFVVDGKFGDITLDVVRKYFKNPNKNEVTEAEWRQLYAIYQKNNL